MLFCFRTLLLHRAGTLGPYLGALLTVQRATLLLDVSNELPVEQRAKKCDQVQQFIEEPPALLAIASCRERDYTRDPGFDRINITPLAAARIQTFARNYLEQRLSQPLDWFVTRELRGPAYLRYVDDFCLFSDSKRQLYECKRAFVFLLSDLRLTIHEPPVQVIPCAHGIPWLGFVVYTHAAPHQSAQVVKFSRRLRALWTEYCADEISFADLRLRCRVGSITCAVPILGACARTSSARAWFTNGPKPKGFLHT